MQMLLSGGAWSGQGVLSGHSVFYKAQVMQPVTGLVLPATMAGYS